MCSGGDVIADDKMGRLNFGLSMRESQDVDYGIVDARIVKGEDFAHVVPPRTITVVEGSLDLESRRMLFDFD